MEKRDKLIQDTAVKAGSILLKRKIQGKKKYLLLV